ncbi:MAG TPA: hypothetical protein VKR32_03465 [Puia sp.]|nr:hypothetical protein [Puia sp.]
MITKEQWNEILDILAVKKFSWTSESGELFRFSHPATTDVGLVYRCHANSFVSFSVNENSDSIRIGETHYQVIKFGRNEQNKFFVYLQKISGRHAGKSSVLTEIASIDQDTIRRN